MTTFNNGCLRCVSVVASSPMVSIISGHITKPFVPSDPSRSSSVNMFAGNPLHRYNNNVDGVDGSSENFDEFLQKRLSSRLTKFLVTTGTKQKKILCLKSKSLQDSRLLYFSLQQLLEFKVFGSVDDLYLNHIVILLGCENPQSPEDLQIWQVVIHLVGAESEILSMFSESLSKVLRLSDTGIFFYEGRSLINLLSNAPRGSVAIAGQALAMVSWHDRSLFDPQTGKKTGPIECGWKRRSLSNPEAPKLYPRIDPVMIACVISPDGSQCLLGNMKKMPRNFFSCLAGFIEPGESVQEAVRREVWEESGIEVGEVEILDSQPWPIGRGGTCELMIGCKAIALTVQTKIQDKDVQEVRWFSLEEAKKMLEASKACTEFPRSSDVPFLPGPYAIAHHLVDNFVRNRDVVIESERARSILSASAALSNVEVATHSNALDVIFPLVWSTTFAFAFFHILHNS